jgi:transposase InsO family protein
MRRDSPVHQQASRRAAVSAMRHRPLADLSAARITRQLQDELKRFVYLAAVMDWASRRVLSWRISITLDSTLCVDAVAEAHSFRDRS